MRASFNNTPTNEKLNKCTLRKVHLINVLYEKKNTISAMFSFRNTQEAVRRETTEGSSFEFIGYRLHSLIPKASMNIKVSGFFDILIGCQDIHILSWSS